MNTLFLQLSTHGKTCRAWLRSTDGFSVLGEGLPAELALSHAGSACVVFLPTSSCLLTSAIASAKQLRQAGQSLGWLVEEQTGEDVENLHVVAGPVEEGDRTPLLAVSKSLLQSLLLELHTAGLQVVAILPDILLLPRDDSEWQLALWPEDQLALRTGELSGAVLEASLLDLMLDAAWQERIAGSEPLRISVTADESFRDRVQSWLTAREIQAEISTAQDASAILSPGTDWPRHPVNLMQGEFALTRGFSLPRTWRIAAMFVALAFSVQLLSEWVQYGYYRYQAQKTQAEAVALYKNLFPADRRIVNLERQLKAQLGGSNSGSNMLSTLTRVAESLQGSGLNTQRVDFSGSTLTLDVSARALGELDRFREKLDGQGFRTEIVSANAQGGLIRGRLRVEG